MNNPENTTDLGGLKHSFGQDVCEISEVAYGGSRWNELHDRIENYFTLFPPESIQQILEESLRKTMVTKFNQALEELNTPEFAQIARLYETVDYRTYQDLVSAQPDTFYYTDYVIKVDDIIKNVASDGYVGGKVKFSYYPFTKFECNEGDDLGEIATNIGHDIHNIPINDYLVLRSALYLKTFPNDQIARECGKLVYRTFPSLYKGAILTFEAYRDMARDIYPMTDINLTEILEIVRDETLERIFLHCVNGQEQVKSLVCADEEYVNQNDEAVGTCRLNAELDDNLIIRGNAGAFKHMLYQFVKNTISYLRTGENAKKDGYLEIIGKKIRLSDSDPELIAIRITDNGPGLDFAKILREKQRLLETKKTLSSWERKIYGCWTSLNLTLFDISKMIFERRVSGRDRNGRHSGIGLAMAMNIIDMHGASIWATNASADDGAKFLLLLDPTENGILKAKYPKLFNATGFYSVPGAMLQQIDRKIDELSNSSIR
jgi:hypothetical protein